MGVSPARVLEVLAGHVGSDAGLTIRDLVAEVTGQASTPALERAARQAVQELRLAGHPIAAHPTYGYFLARSVEEMEFCFRFLRSRALASLRQIQRLRQVALPDLVGQLRLPVGGHPPIPATTQIDLFEWADRGRRPLQVELPPSIWQDVEKFLAAHPEWERSEVFSEALALFLLAQTQAENADAPTE